MPKKPSSSDNNAISADFIEAAIAAGKAIIAEGKPKIEAAMSIYTALVAADQDTVVSAFIDGAALTPKGALTYWYNCRRKYRKLQTKSTE